jgi:hypothetical protein
LRREVMVIGVAAAIVAGLAGGTSAARITTPRTTFYLDLKAGQCAKRVAPKTWLVAPCSNGRHSLEVYAVLHGGWGHATPSPSVVLARARTSCLSRFQARYGPLRRDFVNFFFPDPGTETAKYGDRIVCSLASSPAHAAMGPGTHFHQAAA